MTDDEIQQRLTDLETKSEKQVQQIEELKKLVEGCVSRLESMESSHKGRTPNHLDLKRNNVRDIMRPKQSATTPRTPVKALRNSAGPIRRSTPDLIKSSKRNSPQKIPWKPPGAADVIIYPFRYYDDDNKVINKVIALVNIKKKYGEAFRRHTMHPWRPPGTSMLFCDFDLKKPKKSKSCNASLKRSESLKPAAESATTTTTEKQVTAKRSKKLSAFLKRQNHRELSFNKGDGTIRIFIRGRPITLLVPPAMKDSIDVKNSLPLPEENLKMEWVYGYRGRDCRKNVYYQTNSGDLVYFVAGVVVLHNLKSGEQRHYVEHTDDIKCMDMHPDNVTFATGQVAGHGKQEGKPHVRVWNSITLQTTQVIGLGYFDRAVAVVAFSKSDFGVHLCTIDEANDHNLSVWDWNKKKMLAAAKSSTEAVIDAEFHPTDFSQIYTCGKNHLVFWYFKSGSLTKKTAIYEKYEKPKFVTCITFTDNGNLISGDSSGNIYIWNNDRRGVQSQIQHAHEGPIFSLLKTKKSTLISAGGKDSKLFEWNLETLEKTEFNVELDQLYGSGRAICEIESDTLVVGTTSNCLLKIAGTEVSPILNGHHEELWGLSKHPTRSVFISAAYDKQVSVWDAESHTQLNSTKVDFRIQSVCISSATEGASVDLCVVGGMEGQWAVIKPLESDSEVICNGKEGNEAIQCCEFSPDGNYVALGSRDNAIYVFKVTAEGKLDKHGKCVGHSSFITHIDWSKDSQHLRSNSGDYELLIWTVDNCKQQTSASECAGIEWASCYCIIAFEVAGIWPEGSDGTDINAVAKANSKELLATADDFGKVNLFRYPAYASKSNHKSKAGHSSHVTNVQFLHDDTKLISSGGQDTAIIQWNIV